MYLGSTQPPKEMSTRGISCGSKGGRCVGLTILPPSFVHCLETGSFKLLELLGPLRECIGSGLQLAARINLCKAEG